MPRPAPVTVFASAALLLPLVISAQSPKRAPGPLLSTRAVPIVEIAGVRFRDLDRDGRLSPFEDWRLPAERRARELAVRLTLEEKAGLMMHGTAPAMGAMGAAGVGSAYDSSAVAKLVLSNHVSSMITRLGGSPAVLAEQHNRLQAIAEQSRFAIPLTISTDPRHHFQYVLGASVTEGQFSQWPETLGFGALADTAITRTFGDIARREYRAVGIHMALSPQADLATEPRWSRINATFGEDPSAVGAQTAAYVAGFQHGISGTAHDGVSTVVKHWVGYGASRDGLDGHNYYGRYATFPGGRFADHVKPFLGAFARRVAGVMPTYPILEGVSIDGQPLEQVGAGFNAQLITGLLRGTHKFRGLVVTDWAITNDCTQRCRDGVPAGERPSFADLGMPWGVDSLPMRARFVKAVRAGVDQFGGTDRSDLLVEAVRRGELNDARLTESAIRVLTLKFQQGLFDNPFVDETVASRTVGSATFRRAGQRAQSESMVMLKLSPDRVKIPLVARAGRTMRVYLYNVDSSAVASRGLMVVRELAQADVAIVRLNAPYETLYPGYIFGAMQHDGSLAFREGDPDYEAFRRISAAVPTITTVYLDRPAILTPLRDRSAILLANFGATDEALLDVLTGRAKARGRLPFELPSSMTAVQAQFPDVPHDSKLPLYPIGFRLKY